MFRDGWCGLTRVRIQPSCLLTFEALSLQTLNRRHNICLSSLCTCKHSNCRDKVYEVGSVTSFRLSVEITCKGLSGSALQAAHEALIKLRGQTVLSNGSIRRYPGSARCTSYICLRPALLLGPLSVCGWPKCVPLLQMSNLWNFWAACSFEKTQETLFLFYPACRNVLSCSETKS